MRLKVTFREYCKPEVDPETGEQERGEYIGSFSQEIDGANVAAILETADQKAREYSEKHETDVRVWETAVVVTPRGIK